MVVLMAEKSVEERVLRSDELMVGWKASQMAEEKAEMKVVPMVL